MKLEDNYYQIINMHVGETDGTFYIAIRPECEVYRGHFPGNPVCPGACNMQVIKECAEHLTGQRLHLSVIRRCRLTAVATPSSCPELEIKMNMQRMNNGYNVTAIITDDKQTYMDFKGEMTA